MKCKDTSRLIIDRLAGELSPRQATRLDKHINSCETCRKEFDMLKNIWHTTSGNLKNDKHTKELTGNRRAEIFAIAENEEKRKKSSRLVTRLIEYLAVLMIVVVLAGMMLPALNQAREKSKSVHAESIRKQRELEEMQRQIDEENDMADSIETTIDTDALFGREQRKKRIRKTALYSPSATKKMQMDKTVVVESKWSNTLITDQKNEGGSRAVKKLPVLIKEKSLKQDSNVSSKMVSIQKDASRNRQDVYRKTGNLRMAKPAMSTPEVELSYEITAPSAFKGNRIAEDKARTISLHPGKSFKINLKLWNMTTVKDAKEYFKEHKYPVPTNIKIDRKRNLIIIKAPKKELEKLEGLFKKLQEEEKDLKDLSKGLPFIKCISRPVSTFSIDTDNASYIQARKSIRRGDRPDPLKIRPEEFINYFDYNYRSPQNATFAVYPEAAPSPFRPGNTLLRIAVQGKRLGPDAGTRTHYTILLDTSGSMAVKDRMELAKKALSMMLKKLKSSDYISLLLCGDKTYPVFTAKVLNLKNRKELLNTLNRVTPHGVADFACGISYAYSFAGKYLMKDGANRIVIVSDGIFELNNAGRHNIDTQIEAARKRGISNIVIGLGGDGDDSMLEKVASTGDGSYVFLDTESEAEELFNRQFEARFREIAKDVKIQVEFNSDAVKSYRQVGYKNRQLSKADFRNDKVDAGEVGSGQSVTALYELKIPEKLSDETIVATIRIRYKKSEDMSIEEKVFYLYAGDIKNKFAESSADFKLSAMVAEFAESLRYPETENIALLRGIADRLNGIWMKEFRKNPQVTELLSLIKKSR